VDDKDDTEDNRSEEIAMGCVGVLPAVCEGADCGSCCSNGCLGESGGKDGAVTDGVSDTEDDRSEEIGMGCPKVWPSVSRIGVGVSFESGESVRWRCRLRPFWREVGLASLAGVLALLARCVLRMVWSRTEFKSRDCSSRSPTDGFGIILSIEGVILAD